MRHPHETDERAQQRAEDGGENRNDHGGLQTIPDEEIAFLLEDIAAKTVGDRREKRDGRALGDRLGPIGGDVALEGEDPIPHFIVRVREVDLLLSLFGNVDGSGDHVDLAGGDGGDQTAELHIGELHFFADDRAESLDELNVEAEQLIVLDESKRSAAGADADDQHAAGFRLRELRHAQLALLDPAVHHAGINAILLDVGEEAIEILPQLF